MHASSTLGVTWMGATPHEWRMVWQQYEQTPLKHNKTPPTFFKKKTNSATFSSSFIVLWKKDFSDRINILQCLLFSVKDRPVNEFRFDECLKEDVMWSYQRVKFYYFLLDSLEALCDQQLNEREESSNLHGGCIGDLKQEKTLLCSDYI